MPEHTSRAGGGGGPLRLLHVIDNLGPGGKERQLVELLKGFADAGECESLVVSMSPGSFYKELEHIPGVTIHYLIRKWKYDPLPCVGLYRLVRRYRPRAMIVWDHLTAMYALPAVVVSGVRCINAMIQDAPMQLTRTAAVRARLSFPVADRIVANSRAGLVAYGVTDRRGTVIHNGFDLRRLRGLEDRIAIRARLGVSDALVVGMVSTFRTWKDQPTLIRAAQRVLGARRDVIFLLIGDGETQAACRALVPADCADRIRFLGSVDTGVEAIVSALDIGVLATFTEGISNSIMEYMALGKPVVATDGGGTRELLLDGVTGFLVPPRDDEQLAARITELLDQPDLRRKMGEAGRERLIREFTLERLVEQHRAVCVGP